MIREIDLDEISDGKKYSSNDMVKIGCHDCKGCFSCCTDMGSSIILDPFDIYNLTKATGLSFSDLLNSILELNVIDGLIEPNIRMNIENNQCPFLGTDKRCSIHKLRPGFCRLFPLGRIYEGDDFEYFYQINECSYPEKTKVKIKKWLDIPNLMTYENYIKEHHGLRRRLTQMYESDSEEVTKNINLLYLNTFYVTPYEIDRDFYSQFDERVKSLKALLGDFCDGFCYTNKLL